MTGTQSLVDRFQELANSQKDLIADAEREVTVWKSAHRNCDSEIVALKQEIAALKQSKSSQQVDGSNSLLLCLIDGDGCIFNESLLMLGAEGGRDAAFRLRQHIIAHYGSNQDLLVNVFFNREGLGKTLKTCLGIQPGTFSAFITGFNTASPLMSMLDVGVGKEAADAKIREQMRIFIRFPHVKKIYFGGGHDNGYTNNLAAIHNEGYRDKVVLLQSYTQLAAEIKALGLPCLENNGVFLAQKLSAKTVSNAQLNSNAPSPAPGINRTKSGAKASGTSMPAPPPPPPSGKIKVPTAKNFKANVTTLKALKPRACNHHYLTRKGCPMGTLCPYGHEYEFSPEMIADLRDLVKQNPCLITVKGQDCTDDECPFAHKCPQGRNCDWHKDGSCKFSVPGMHGSPVPQSVLGSDEDRILVAPYLAMHARNGSSSSNADFTPIPTPSPNKKAAKTRQATPNKLVQTKLAFKNSVSGSTQAERLAQMGVVQAAGVRPVFNDDEEEESEETFHRDYPARPLNGNGAQYRGFNPSGAYRVID